jgi:DNA-binding MarR family transcriptional regulator
MSRSERHAAEEAAARGVDLGPLPGHIGFALRRTRAAVARELSGYFAAEGVRPAQYPVLIVLSQNPGLKAAQVAAAIGIGAANLVPLLDRLEALGLAERRRAKGDRRASALFITEAGAAMLERLAPLVTAHEQLLAARLGEGGCQQLMRLLLRLTDPAFDPPGATTTSP